MTVVKVLLVIKSPEMWPRAHHQCFSCKACNQRIKQQLMATLQCTRLLSSKTQQNNPKLTTTKKNMVDEKLEKRQEKHIIYIYMYYAQKEMLVDLKKLIEKNDGKGSVQGKRNIKKQRNVPGPLFHHL